jgi:hypothetical protein
MSPHGVQQSRCHVALLAEKPDFHRVRFNGHRSDLVADLLSYVCDMSARRISLSEALTRFASTTNCSTSWCSSRCRSLGTPWVCLRLLFRGRAALQAIAR